MSEILERTFLAHCGDKTHRKVSPKMRTLLQATLTTAAATAVTTATVMSAAAMTLTAATVMSTSAPAAEQTVMRQVVATKMAAAMGERFRLTKGH